MKQIEVKKRKRVDQDVWVKYWDNEGNLYNGWADIYDDGSALIRCKDDGKVIREAGCWLRMLDYKIVSGIIIERAVKIAKARYGK